MSVRRAFSLVSVSAASIIFGLVAAGQTAAQDVRHECSEKYQAAKAAGTLSDTWPQFYSKCAAEAKESAAAAEAAAAPAPPDIRHICSEKYQAAKAAGTLNGQTWPQFYSQCTAEVKANPPAAATAAPAAPAPPPAIETPAPPVAAAPPVEAPPPVAAAPAVEAPPPPAVAAPAPPVATPAPVNPLKTPKTKAAAPAVAAAPGTAVFPSAIAAAYAKEKPADARRKTCLDQYKANKATNANGGLKWIQKGGGYWSECNKRLKG